MMAWLNVDFAAPMALLALVALPALWLLLRVHPPRPRAIPFPPIAMMADFGLKQPEPRRLPIWLVILRSLLAVCVVLATAGPTLHRERFAMTGSSPLLLMVDSGWAAARDWSDRMAIADDLVNEADQAGRPVALLATSQNNAAIDVKPSGEVKARLHALVPSAFAVDRTNSVAAADAFLKRYPDAEIVWISDGIGHASDPSIGALVKGHHFTVVLSDKTTVAIAGIANMPEGFSVRMVRDRSAAEWSGLVRAFDAKSRVIGETHVTFPASTATTTAIFALPTELRNEIARLEVEGARSAGAVALVDGQSRRRKVGLVASSSVDVAQPLLSPIWFVAQALRPYADLIEPRGGPSEAISAVLDAKASVVILADIGSLPAEVEKRMADYVLAGGVLVRFAGPRMATIRDNLMPVRIRPGDRALGGALSWETPRTLAPFPSGSLFAGLETPPEITISRQLLAEPDADLAHKTWAALSDGTPIVTAEKRGQGKIVLFHITADTSWSSLPLSGVFVAMLRKVVALSATGEGRESAAEPKDAAPPFKTLNGFGDLGDPSSGDRPADRGNLAVADHDHSAGLYGDPEDPFALNVLNDQDTLLPIDFSGIDVTQLPLDGARSIDLRLGLLILVVTLFALDSVATFILRGGNPRRMRWPVKPLAMVALLISIGLFGSAQKTLAGAIAPKDAEGALSTHLAYVITGDATLDAESREGLVGLTAYIADRTALEPGDVVGVDLARDDLAVYPMLYWPMAPGRPIPDIASLAKVDAFMRDGGTVIFDTHDAALVPPGSDSTPETRTLRRILAGLSVPELEPVPADHVLTKAFYLINRFPGRYAEGKTWIEALPKGNIDAEQPVRAGDGVSPILITSNDLAADWATDRNGEPLYPLTQSMPRQREMALRAGTNIVMYVLTGNYKADQVHVPALLERLGK